jgi:hypothetical protein
MVQAFIGVGRGFLLEKRVRTFSRFGVGEATGEDSREVVVLQIGDRGRVGEDLLEVRVFLKALLSYPFHFFAALELISVDGGEFEVIFELDKGVIQGVYTFHQNLVDFILSLYFNRVDAQDLTQDRLRVLFQMHMVFRQKLQKDVFLFFLHLFDEELFVVGLDQGLASLGPWPLPHLALGLDNGL